MKPIVERVQNSHCVDGTTKLIPKAIKEPRPMRLTLQLYEHLTVCICCAALDRLGLRSHNRVQTGITILVVSLIIRTVFASPYYVKPARIILVPVDRLLQFLFKWNLWFPVEILFNFVPAQDMPHPQELHLSFVHPLLRYRTHHATTADARRLAKSRRPSPCRSKSRTGPRITKSTRKKGIPA
jgi:hypothetical protein